MSIEGAAILLLYLIVIVGGTWLALAVKRLRLTVESAVDYWPRGGVDSECPGPYAETRDVFARDIRSLNDRVTTFGLQLGKIPTMGAHSDLCEKVANLDRGLRSLAERHAEFTAATAEAVDALKGRIMVIEGVLTADDGLPIPENDPE